MPGTAVPSHPSHHSAQIRASLSAPSEPGSPTFPAPSRSCPNRAQMTTAMRSSYKRPSPKPAHTRNRAVAKDGAAEDVGELHRAEHPAVGALLWAVTQHGAGPIRQGGDSLQHQARGLPRVADEHDLAHAWLAPKARDNYPVAG